MTPRRSLSLVAIGCALALAAPAFPVVAFAQQPSSPSGTSAAELKKRGDDAMDSLRYDDAIVAYLKSYDLSHDPAVLYNLGRVYQARGDFPHALEYLERFDREASPELKQKVPLLAQLIGEVRAKVALLTITCNVQGARVVVRDTVLGITPFDKPLRLVAGAATVEVTAEGYAPFKRPIELVGGTTVVLDAQLVKPSRAGILLVRAPDGIVGTVLVDGKRVGNTPVEISVTAGAHTIVVKAEGKLDSETQAVVASGERKEIEVALASPTPLTGKWWFWTGVGVVVVGGAVVTYALLTERKADNGDKFGPSQLSAPLVKW